MKIIINGKTAVLKKGTSFDFVAENRSFTGSDSYTLSITFPLRGCAQNIAIFGNINRTDIDNPKVLFDCEIIDINFYRAGTITIVEASDTEIKTQFLEGRSVQNFDTTFDEIYINELDLGEYPAYSLSNSPTTYWRGIVSGDEAVALPWANNASGNIQNEVVYADNSYSYHSDCKGLSFQPYLIVIVKRICDALGYSYDVSQWEARGDLRCLLICNTLPWTWDIPQFARALPHWSVTEFFEKLENFLGGEFNIDHKAMSIKFEFTAKILEQTAPTYIKKIIDSYTAEFSSEDETNYIESANVKYKECSHNMWKVYCCPWLIKYYENYIVKYDTLEELIAENKWMARLRRYGRGTNVNNVLYAKDIDTYFVIRCVRTEYAETVMGRDFYDKICVLQPINVFGDKIVDKDNENNIELDFVPVWIDDTEASKGSCMFLELNGYSEEEDDESGSTAGTRPNGGTNTEVSFDRSEVVQPIPMQVLTGGDVSESSNAEYYDRIYIGHWNGVNNFVGKLPQPAIDKICFHEDWSYHFNIFSMRLTDSKLGEDFKINPKQKYQFTFIANDIPNVRSIFFINGKKYLCEKITATFTENGMSQLMKGNFYRII